MFAPRLTTLVSASFPKQKAAWVQVYPKLLARVRDDPFPSGSSTGNVSSRIYHAPGCRYYNCKNCTREFRSKEEADCAGYRGCKICKP